MKVSNSISEIPAAQWNALAGEHPLLQHAFLCALEESGCVTKKTGWQPEHLTWWEGETLVAALPLYRKTHSYGEYVFDWAWARAFTEAGGAYYPKLVSALPFTPCPGARMLARDASTRAQSIRETLAYAGDAEVSSLHVLLSDEAEAKLWNASGALLRTGLQFHWQNPGVASFDNYLGTMNHDKRKRIKQERRRVTDAGVSLAVKVGDAITDADWAHFYRCYENTYVAHRSTPYLSLGFFKTFARANPTAQVMVIGTLGGDALCAALNWRGGDVLYGRYWGALGYVPGLHFEACYYQALAWCIENGVQRFEGGAQGEHKLARGFLPVETYSAHWIAHPDFAEAVERFLRRERAGVTHALSELEDSSPFKTVVLPE
jgi:uncharacterized protein